MFNSLSLSSTAPSPLLTLLMSLLVVLVTTRAIGSLLVGLGQPRVVGEILGGSSWVLRFWGGCFR